MARERHGNDMGTAWARHAMCESAFKVCKPVNPTTHAATLNHVQGALHAHQHVLNTQPEGKFSTRNNCMTSFDVLIAFNNLSSTHYEL